jgi:hypothetical protein
VLDNSLKLGGTSDNFSNLFSLAHPEQPEKKLRKKTYKKTYVTLFERFWRA